ncbi:hypothetical protein BN871_BM_00400 [Paenibacillus sp. P22]|nr:hypothetical protein BN871_BM_00400 [Paenibacillus sp. P22]
MKAGSLPAASIYSAAGLFLADGDALRQPSFRGKQVVDLCGRRQRGDRARTRRRNRCGCIGEREQLSRRLRLDAAEKVRLALNAVQQRADEGIACACRVDDAYGMARNLDAEVLGQPRRSRRAAGIDDMPDIAGEQRLQRLFLFGDAGNERQLLVRDLHEMGHREELQNGLAALFRAFPQRQPYIGIEADDSPGFAASGNRFPVRVFDRRLDKVYRAEMQEISRLEPISDLVFLQQHVRARIAVKAEIAVAVRLQADKSHRRIRFPRPEHPGDVHAGFRKRLDQEVAEGILAKLADECAAAAKPRHRAGDIGGCPSRRSAESADCLQLHASLLRNPVNKGFPDRKYRRHPYPPRFCGLPAENNVKYRLRVPARIHKVQQDVYGGSRNGRNEPDDRCEAPDPPMARELLLVAEHDRRNAEDGCHGGKHDMEQQEHEIVRLEAVRTAPVGVADDKRSGRIDDEEDQGGDRPGKHHFFVRFQAALDGQIPADCDQNRAQYDEKGADGRKNRVLVQADPHSNPKITAKQSRGLNRSRRSRSAQVAIRLRIFLTVPLRENVSQNAAVHDFLNQLHQDAAQLLILCRSHQIEEGWPLELAEQLLGVAGDAVIHRLRPYVRIVVDGIHRLACENNERAGRSQQHAAGEYVRHLPQAVEPAPFRHRAGDLPPHHHRCDEQHEIVELMQQIVGHDVIMRCRDVIEGEQHIEQHQREDRVHGPAEPLPERLAECESPYISRNAQNDERRSDQIGNGHIGHMKSEHEMAQQIHRSALGYVQQHDSRDGHELLPWRCPPFIREMLQPPRADEIEISDQQSDRQKQQPGTPESAEAEIFKSEHEAVSFLSAALRPAASGHEQHGSGHG